MPRLTERRDIRVTLELSHPTGGHGERAELRIIDDLSGVQLLQVALTPEHFYKLLAGRIDGTTAPAELVTGRIFPRIGQKRHWFQRHIGYGVEESNALRWAEALRVAWGLDSVEVHSRQGGLWATWELWSNGIADEDLATITHGIGSADLPPAK